MSPSRGGQGVLSLPEGVRGVLGRSYYGAIRVYKKHDLGVVGYYGAIRVYNNKIQEWLGIMGR